MPTLKLQTATTRGIETIPVTVIVKYKYGRDCTGVIEFPGHEGHRAREGCVRAVAAATSMTPLCTIANLSVEYRDPQGQSLEHEAGFDLALGVALLRAWRYKGIKIQSKARYIGELGFDGSVRPVRGALVRVSGAPAILPRSNSVDLLAEPSGQPRIFVDSLADALGPTPRPSMLKPIEPSMRDESVMKLMRRDGSLHDGEDLINAVMSSYKAGRNVLLLGSVGCGKTMLARRIATRLNNSRPLVGDERLEMAKIWSISGLANGNLERPFRAPHHSVSEAGLVGDSKRPGELSLAHGGVLYLDELNEFRRTAMASLQRAMKFGCSFPAKPAMVIGSAAPCPCGYRLCSCRPETKDTWMRGIRAIASDFNMDIIDIQEAQ